MSLCSNLNYKKTYGLKHPTTKSPGRWSLLACADISEDVSTSDQAEEQVMIGVEYARDGSRVFKFGPKKDSIMQLTEDSTGQEVVNGTANSNSRATPHSETSAPHQESNAELPDPQIKTKGYTSDADTCAVPIQEDPGKDSGVEVEVCPLSLDIGVAAISHPARAQTGSEDAYFVEGTWIGLADGISSWADMGVNSGMYAREMMWNCVETLRSRESETNPKSVIIDSHEQIDLQGSCTVLLAIMDGSVLNAANVGDNRLMVIRNGAVFAQTGSMLHTFNDPFNIGANGPDQPEDAEAYSILLEPRDIVLLGSDGLFDNVFEADILQILLESVEAGKSPEGAAKCLATTAHKNSVSTNGSTPFSVGAKAMGKAHEGGKKDDITCIVAYVA